MFPAFSVRSALAYPTVRKTGTAALICAVALGISSLHQAEAGWGNDPVVACLGETANPKPNPPDYSDDDLSLIHERLDRDICWIAPTDTNVQLLRAGLVIAVSARYAAAAIERYSENREEMAVRIIPKVNKALDALDKARTRLASQEAGKPDHTYFEVHRADLIMRIAELLAAASEPTRSEIRGLLSASLNLSFAKRAFDLLKNATVNELYGDAYRNSFRQHIRGIASNGNVSVDDFKVLTALLRGDNGGCTRLEAMSGNDNPRCKIPKAIE